MRMRACVSIPLFEETKEEETKGKESERSSDGSRERENVRETDRLRKTDRQKENEGKTLRLLEEEKPVGWSVSTCAWRLRTQATTVCVSASWTRNNELSQ
mmetsp:Transcript_48037/g.94896  ORF Transcript_48037/g.94896 Transcript_48037/m.94896 type:complete len:100 (-) Transcript_48037:1848-2147(-)